MYGSLREVCCSILPIDLKSNGTVGNSRPNRKYGPVDGHGIIINATLPGCSAANRDSPRTSPAITPSIVSAEIDLGIVTWT